MQIAIIGGTGKAGRGLEQRLAVAGHWVSIGSRDVERARAVARELAPAMSSIGWVALALGLIAIGVLTIRFRTAP